MATRPTKFTALEATESIATEALTTSGTVTLNGTAAVTEADATDATSVYALANALKAAWNGIAKGS